MAQRDKTQGFGFVYVDIANLFASRDLIDKRNSRAQAIPSPTEAKTLNFNKDPQPRAVTPAPEKPAGRDTAIQQIRENLDRLQSLHHKLHAMLEELTHITDRDKKPR